MNADTFFDYCSLHALCATQLVRAATKLLNPRALSVAAILLFTSAIQAQTYNWQATTSANWGTSGSFNTTPIAGGGTADILNFNGTTSYTATDNLTGAFQLNQMNFNNTGTGTTVTIAFVSPATGITFAGTNAILNVASTDTAAVTINAPITLAAATTFTNTGSGLLTIGGNITGATYNLVISGAGNTTIGGTLTTTGTLTIGVAAQTTGIVSFTNATAPSTGNISVLAGTLQTGGITLTSTKTIALSTGATYSPTGTLSFTAGGSNYTGVSGAGNLVLANSSSTSTAGDIQYGFGTSSKDNTTISTPINLGSGNRWIYLQSNNNDYATYGGDLIISGALTGTSASTLNLNGLPQNNDATLTLSGNNASFTGAVNILRGNLALVNTAALSSSNNVSFSPVASTDATLYLFGRSITIGSLNSATTTGTQQIRNGGGTGGNASFGGSAASKQDAVLTITQTTPGTFVGIISDGPDDHRSGDSGTYNKLGIALGASSNSTLALTGANTYTGGTSIAAGTLSFASGSLSTTGTIAFTGNSTLQWNGTNIQDISARLTINDGVTATIDTQGNAVTFGTALGVGTLQTGALTKIGSGTLTLGAANTFSGGVNLNGGSITLTNAGGLGTGTLTIATTANTSPLTGGGSSPLSVQNNIVLPSPSTNTTYVFTENAAGQQLNLLGNVSGGSSHTTLEFNSDTQSDSTTTYVLAGTSNSFTATIDINRGALIVTSASSLGASTNKLILASNQNLTSGNLRFTVGGFTLPNPIQINATYPINTDANMGTNNSVTLSGVVSGVGSVYKLGAGTLTLNNTETYSGATTIAAGTLAIGASGTINYSPSISIASGAVLDTSALSNFTIGTGGPTTLTAGRTTGFATDINGPLTLATGGTINVGPSLTPATITHTGNLTLSGGGTINVNLNGASVTAGQGVNSLIAVSGNLAASGITTFALTSLGGGFASGNYTLITYGGTLSGGAVNFGYSGLTGSRQMATIDTTTTPGSVLLDVSGNPANLVWNGAGTTWDTSTNQYWFNMGTSMSDQFYTNDNVTFNETGSANPTVTVNTSVTPSSVTFSNTATNYTLTGTGGISGTTTTLTKSGAASVTISTTNSFAGGVFLNGGTIIVATVANTGTNSPLGSGGNINFNGGALSYSGSTAGTTNRPIVIGAGGGTVGVSTAGVTLTLAGVISSGVTSPAIDGGLTINGSGTIALSNSANTFTGPVTVNSGANLSVAADGNLGAVPSAQNASAITVNGTLTTTAGFALNANRGITGSGSLIASAGTLTLPNTNTYSGGTQLNAGSLSIGTGDALGTGPLNVNLTASATFLTVANTAAVTIANNIVLSTPGSAQTLLLLKNSASSSTGTQLDFTGMISGGNANTTLEFNSNTSGDSTTTYRLSGNNNFTVGTIDINRGVLVVNNINGLGAGTNVVQLDSNANNTIGNLSFQLSGTFANPVTITSASAYPIGVTGSNVVYLSSPITASSNFVKVDTGTLVTLATNVIGSHNVLVNGGTLQIGNGGTTGALGSTGTVAVATGATLAYNRSDSVTVSNAIGGAGGFTQLGGGTVSLTGTNTYGGNTSVSGGGTLVVGVASVGSLGNTAVTVNTGATLQGTGTIGGSVTVSGVIQPGDATSNGTLHVGGLSLVGGQMNIKLATTTTTLNTVAITGAFSFDNMSVLQIDANATNVTLNPASNYSFTIGTSGTSTTGLSVTTQSQFSFINNNGVTFTYSLSGDSSGDIILNLTGTPEPSQLLLFGAANLMLGALVRRRSQVRSRIAGTSAMDGTM